ncbi:BnaC06g03370D [Brassica napus]|uniref:BnaC06g03370D protein n=1 Tax=Brassica napus TaxID=3708 RepID=A0A078HXV5_BRANA|nr:BnaC06g03370D [Brassica napus]
MAFLLFITMEGIGESQ